ncbi:MAG: hypothetical protein ACXAAH_06290 [Promethearchaeota archaeon]|jgi:hypothetical protein
MDKTDNNKSKKREQMQYFDLFFGLFNSFVMSFLVLINLRSVVVALIAHVFIIFMVIGMIFTFLKKNPFYMFFIYGALLCGGFYSLPGILIIPSMNFIYGIFDYIIFGITCLEIIYLIIKTKDSALLETWGRMALIRDRAQYDASLSYALENPELGIIQEQKALAAELKEKQEKQEYNLQYKRTWIILISIISVVGYYLTFFYSFGLY